MGHVKIPVRPLGFLLLRLRTLSDALMCVVCAKKKSLINFICLKFTLKVYLSYLSTVIYGLGSVINLQLANSINQPVCK